MPNKPNLFHPVVIIILLSVFLVILFIFVVYPQSLGMVLQHININTNYSKTILNDTQLNNLDDIHLLENNINPNNSDHITLITNDDNKKKCSKSCPIIFIHIQKTGGGSIKTFLQNNDLWNNNIYHPRHLDAFHAKNKYSKKTWATSCKLAFVRNPWSRTLSWYSMWITGHTGRGIGVGVILKDCNCTTKCTFTHFVTHCTKLVKSIEGMKGITRPQNDYIMHNGSIIVDFIGKTESLEQDLKVFLKKTCNWKQGMMDKFPHVRHNSNHTDYHDYYDNITMNLVQNWYHKDLELFNYSFI